MQSAQPEGDGLARRPKGPCGRLPAWLRHSRRRGPSSNGDRGDGEDPVTAAQYKEVGLQRPRPGRSPPPDPVRPAPGAEARQPPTTHDAQGRHADRAENASFRRHHATIIHQDPALVLNWPTGLVDWPGAIPKIDPAKGSRMRSCVEYASIETKTKIVKRRAAGVVPDFGERGAKIGRGRVIMRVAEMAPPAARRRACRQHRRQARPSPRQGRPRYLHETRRASRARAGCPTRNRRGDDAADHHDPGGRGGGGAAFGRDPAREQRQQRRFRAAPTPAPIIVHRRRSPSSQRKTGHAPPSSSSPASPACAPSREHHRVRR
jgi:hypothetical protein